MIPATNVFIFYSLNFNVLKTKGNIKKGKIDHSIMNNDNFIVDSASNDDHSNVICPSWASLSAMK